MGPRSSFVQPLKVFLRRPPKLLGFPSSPRSSTVLRRAVRLTSSLSTKGSTSVNAASACTLHFSLASTLQLTASTTSLLSERQYRVCSHRQKALSEVDILTSY